eukprot:1396345-Prymnesium_polylepis.4
MATVGAHTATYASASHCAPPARCSRRGHIAAGPRCSEPRGRSPRLPMGSGAPEGRPQAQRARRRKGAHRRHRAPRRTGIAAAGRRGAQRAHAAPPPRRAAPRGTMARAHAAARGHPCCHRRARAGPVAPRAWRHARRHADTAVYPLVYTKVYGRWPMLSPKA